VSVLRGKFNKQTFSSSFFQYKRSCVKLMRGQTELAWRSAVLTVFVLLILVMIVCQLSINYHVLGTNKIGEDVFYVSLKSVRTGLLIGSLSLFFMLPFALFLGPFAGYFGGWVDDLIQYIYTTVSSIPGVLLISACLLILKAQIHHQVMLANSFHVHSALTHRDYRDDIQFIGLCLILGLTSWAGLCRLLRAETMKLREQPFVTASRVLGQRSFRIIFRHILPNLMHIVLITVVLDFSGLILAEAVLTYVGVGVPLSLHSWGNMINSARLELSRDPVVWWPLVSAIGFMFVFVLCINLFADTVRDAFDPRG
jgi:peptide/nickel transport system permease protein